MAYLDQAKISTWPEEFFESGRPGVQIADVLKSRGLDAAKVGLVGLVGLSDASVPAEHFRQLQDGLSKGTVEDATQLFEDARHTNSEEELSYFRAASDLFKEIYTELQPKIRPGMTENDLAAESHAVSKRRGLRDPMVLLQVTPYGPISFGSSREIQSDDIVTVWIESAGPSGY